MATGTTPFLATLVAMAMLSSAAAAKTIRVAIGDLVFLPAATTAEVGDTIEWTNADFIDHTATAEDSSWDVTIPKAATRSVVLDRVGRLEYFCRFHPTMRGSIDVR
jgi:plastocyanin